TSTGASWSGDSSSEVQRMRRLMYGKRGSAAKPEVNRLWPVTPQLWPVSDRAPSCGPLGLPMLGTSVPQGDLRSPSRAGSREPRTICDAGSRDPRTTGTVRGRETCAQRDPHATRITRCRRALTLVELLIAMTITLIMSFALVQMFQ